MGKTNTDPLLQPFQLGHLTLKNRIMSTSHEPNYHENGMPTDAYRAYHVEKAKGGMALTMTAGSAIVSRDSPPSFGNLHAYSDDIIPWLKQLTSECHRYDCKVMIQLTHLGRRTNWNHSDWLPVISASPVREPAHRAFPKEMEDWDIERVINDYVAASIRMQEAGLDGIEIECYGHLMDSFWSPLTNHRNDEYGGSLDNRLRFSLRTYSAIREAVGDQFLVGSRLVLDEQIEKGIDKEEGLHIAKRLKESQTVDFFNVIRGNVNHDAPLTKVIPVTGMASNPHLDFAGEVREVTNFPVFHAARINDVATARHAIASGKLDMVGMTRAHIADPHIVKKIEAGVEEEIRPCVGATYCLDRIYEGHGTLCAHNPSTGRELTMPHVLEKADSQKSIVIVGAGPAGLEAARVCAERGHRVTLFEAANEVGGQMRLAARLPRRKEIIGIIDWRANECERLGVRFEMNQYVDGETVQQMNPDIIVVATGGLPQTTAIDSGHELAINSWDILSGDAKVANNVLFFDDNGAHSSMSAAEAIAESGANLEIVTPERTFAPEIGGMNLVPYMQSLQRNQATITAMQKIRHLERDNNQLRAVLWSHYTHADCGERLVDQVVVDHATAPLDELYFELKEASSNRGEIDQLALIKCSPQTVATNKEGKFQLFRIGDAVAARNVHAAIYDALRLCRVF